MFCYKVSSCPIMPLLCTKGPSWEAEFKLPLFSTMEAHWSLGQLLMSMEQTPLLRSLPLLLQTSKRKAPQLRISLCSQRFKIWNNRGSRWNWPRKSDWGGRGWWGNATWGRRDDGRLQKWRRTRTSEHRLKNFAGAFEVNEERERLNIMSREFCRFTADWFPYCLLQFHHCHFRIHSCICHLHIIRIWFWWNMNLFKAFLLYLLLWWNKSLEINI